MTFIEKLRARKKAAEQKLEDVCNLNNYKMDEEDDESKSNEELNTPGQKSLDESDDEFTGYSI